MEKLSPEALVVWLELERLGLEHRANEGLGTGRMGEDPEQPGGEEEMITYRVPCKRCQGEEG